MISMTMKKKMPLRPICSGGSQLQWRKQTAGRSLVAGGSVRPFRKFIVISNFSAQSQTLKAKSSLWILQLSNDSTEWQCLDYWPLLMCLLYRELVPGKAGQRRAALISLLSSCRFFLFPWVTFFNACCIQLGSSNSMTWFNVSYNFTFKRLSTQPELWRCDITVQRATCLPF